MCKRLSCLAVRNAVPHTQSEQQWCLQAVKRRLSLSQSDSCSSSVAMKKVDGGSSWLPWYREHALWMCGCRHLLKINTIVQMNYWLAYSYLFLWLSMDNGNTCVNKHQQPADVQFNSSHNQFPTCENMPTLLQSEKSRLKCLLQQRNKVRVLASRLRVMSKTSWTPQNWNDLSLTPLMWGSAMCRIWHQPWCCQSRGAPQPHENILSRETPMCGSR